MAANRPYTAAYGHQPTYYATAPAGAAAPPPGAVTATPIPAATTVPSYAAGKNSNIFIVILITIKSEREGKMGCLLHYSPRFFFITFSYFLA